MHIGESVLSCHCHCKLDRIPARHMERGAMAYDGERYQQATKSNLARELSEMWKCGDEKCESRIKKPRAAANFESTPNGLNPPDNCGKLDEPSRVVQTLAEWISHRSNEIRTATPAAAAAAGKYSDSDHLRQQHYPLSGESCRLSA